MNPQDESRSSGQQGGARQQQVDVQRPWESGRQGGGSHHVPASRRPEQGEPDQAGQDQPGAPSGLGSNHGSASNLARSLADSGNGASPAGGGPTNRDDSPRKPGSSPDRHSRHAERDGPSHR